MREVSSRRGGSLSLAQLQRINAMCDGFERAWKGGTRQGIEDYLDDTPEAERSALLRERIALDLAARRQARPVRVECPIPTAISHFPQEGTA